VFEVLEAPTTPDPHPTPTRPFLTRFGSDRMSSDSSSTPELVFDQVRFQYGRASDLAIPSLSQPGSRAEPASADIDAKRGRWVLDQISLSVAKGELVGLVGESGAGKSTIALLAAGLCLPVHGRVMVAGRDTAAWSAEDLAQRAALITQDTHILHDTIRANLAYVRPGASDLDMLEACEAARLWAMIRSLPQGLDTVVGEKGYRLSGGERQRLAVARALLKQAELIVLDEPTSQLDTETEFLMKQATSELFARRAVLIVAHRLSTIADATRILVLHEGRIAEQGNHRELVSRPSGRYNTLYCIQSGTRAVLDAAV
jgi:ATP-binding cassette, subfamily B, bacterial